MLDLSLITFAPINKQKAHKNIGMIYDMSKAIAVRLKIAFAATGDAKSKKPGRILKIVVAQMAYKGVCVYELTRPKSPRSGRP